MAEKNKVECSVCKKQFSEPSNLRKHIRKFHPLQADDQNMLLYYKNSKNFNFTCDCGRNFTHKRHFKSHQLVHNDQVNKQKSTRKKCPLCDYGNLLKFKMLNHFKEAHDIKIENREFNFPSIKEFDQWKADMESETYSRYVKNSKFNKPSSQNSVENIYYCCHRSGVYTPRGKGFRMLKMKGSNKINAYCPSSLQLTKFSNGSCKVNLIETHVGHDLEIDRLSLTSSERNNLASRIAAGIPFNEIIDEVRQSADPDAARRLHLLTKKDLHNIEHCFNKSSTTKKAKGSNVESNSIEIRDTIGYAKVGELLPKNESLKNSLPNNIKTMEEQKEELIAEFSYYLNRINSSKELEKIRAMINSLFTVKDK